MGEQDVHGWIAQKLANLEAALQEISTSFLDSQRQQQIFKKEQQNQRAAFNAFEVQITHLMKAINFGKLPLGANLQDEYPILEGEDHPSTYPPALPPKTHPRTSSTTQLQLQPPPPPPPAHAPPPLDGTHHTAHHQHSH